METVPFLLGTVQGVHSIQVYRHNVSIGIFQRLWELFPFSLTLFIVLIIYRYTDKICPSVYSSDHGNCFYSTWHYSRCSLHTSILMECVCRYILETMRTVPLLPDTVHGVNYIRVYRQNVSVGIFQRLRIDHFSMHK
jgi:hypothetical protein